MNQERILFQMLQQQGGRTSFHMPGHQGKSPFAVENSFLFDTTELEGTDTLYNPVGAIERCEKEIALRANTVGSLLLTGGSTAGILTMLLYAVAPEDKIIIPRGAHQSIFHGCILAGAIPIYVYPEILKDGYSYYTPQAYIKAIEENPDAKAVFVTRPDYYGQVISLEIIAEKAKEKGQLLLVDEAHGAHFNWWKTIKNAGELGADLFVQSAHKTLPVLTQGGWLHYQQAIDPKLLRQKLQVVQTSSPSFLLMKSLDDGRVWMDHYGEKALAKLTEYVKTFFMQLKGTGYKNAFDFWQKKDLVFDPTRMVITAPEGGFALAKTLEQQGIDVEMADDHTVVCIPSVMTQRKAFHQLAEVLVNHAETKSRENPIAKKGLYQYEKQLEAKLSLREAFFAPKEWIPLEKAEGRISGVAAGLYPPGMPWILPGEIITQTMAMQLLQLEPERTFGVTNQGVYCIK
ncbi:MAG: aminotransferase class I/II-fold pyridoxal phosphate-dependent enzyme [Clostridiales bacterium]|nr:aminotransferase class I/II-fold pyridoxal phosphate-dependent enzyme [Clostridiales bacterium]